MLSYSCYRSELNVRYDNFTPPIVLFCSMFHPSARKFITSIRKQQLRHLKTTILHAPYCIEECTFLAERISVTSPRRRKMSGQRVGGRSPRDCDVTVWISLNVPCIDDRMDVDRRRQPAGGRTRCRRRTSGVRKPSAADWTS